ncbi:MAG: hypothetical protein Q6363_001995 [Candidatus Njordarchaeota archaeon]
MSLPPKKIKKKSGTIKTINGFIIQPSKDPLIKTHRKIDKQTWEYILDNIHCISRGEKLLLLKGGVIPLREETFNSFIFELQSIYNRRLAPLGLRPPQIWANPRGSLWLIKLIF